MLYERVHCYFYCDKYSLPFSFYCRRPRQSMITTRVKSQINDLCFLNFRTNKFFLIATMSVVSLLLSGYWVMTRCSLISMTRTTSSLQLLLVSNLGEKDPTLITTQRLQTGGSKDS